MWIVYVLAGFAILIIGTAVALSLYKKSYFKSVKFLSLKYDMDEIRAQYGILSGVLEKFSKSIYANFSPAANKQMEMQSYRTGAMEQNATLPEHTYFCTTKHLQEIKDYEMKALRDYCGFSSNAGTMQLLKEQASEFFDFDQRVKAFQRAYDEQIKSLDSQVPIVIKMTAKSELIEKLGLNIEKDWETKMCPRYTFKDMTSNKSHSLILTPIKLGELIAYLDQNPEQKRSTLNLRKEVSQNVKK